MVGLCLFKNRSLISIWTLGCDPEKLELLKVFAVTNLLLETMPSCLIMYFCLLSNLRKGTSAFISALLLHSHIGNLAVVMNLNKLLLGWGRTCRLLLEICDSTRRTGGLWWMTNKLVASKQITHSDRFLLKWVAACRSWMDLLYKSLKYWVLREVAHIFIDSLSCQRREVGSPRGQFS